ncbi:hypothetical protein WN944_022331 [Citrus x changshan-huyou]|uniref:Uncharacterized protein n=1 Tax=Citrus x changshan-huyou TaxID=2935761 RepID=A0AAP0N4E4_9ROSI
MTCIINSTQSLVLATAMVVSSTVLFLAFSKQKNDSKEPQEETLRSCLYSEEKKRGRKKKRVQFAENVKDTAGNGEEYRKEYNKKFAKQFDRTCRNDQIQGMPANRVALYHGILRDRVHRMEYSY